MMKKTRIEFSSLFIECIIYFSTESIKLVIALSNLLDHQKLKSDFH